MFSATISFQDQCWRTRPTWLRIAPEHAFGIERMTPASPFGLVSATSIPIQPPWARRVDAGLARARRASTSTKGETDVSPNSCPRWPQGSPRAAARLRRFVKTLLLKASRPKPPPASGRGGGRRRRSRAPGSPERRAGRGGGGLIRRAQGKHRIAATLAVIRVADVEASPRSGHVAARAKGQSSRRDRVQRDTGPSTPPLPALTSSSAPIQS